MKEVNSDRDVIYRMSHVKMAVQLTALTEVPTSGLNVETNECFTVRTPEPRMDPSSPAGQRWGQQRP